MWIPRLCGAQNGSDTGYRHSFSLFTSDMIGNRSRYRGYKRRNCSIYTLEDERQCGHKHIQNVVYTCTSHSGYEANVVIPDMSRTVSLQGAGVIT